MNKKLLIGVTIILLATIGLVYVLLSPQIKESVKTEKVYRVGILSGLDLFSGIAVSFKEELTNMGYKEGENIVYDLRNTNFEPDKEKQILNEFVTNKVDLIFGFNTEVALEAKKATEGTNIPVVFANSFIEGNGLVQGLLKPGGNITGVRYPGTDVAVKRLEVLHELAPHAKRIWLPYQKGYPAVPAELEVIRPVATSLHITLIEFASENLASLQAELERRSQSDDIGFDAVLFIPESLSTTKVAFETIANFTRSRKIPIGGSRIETQDYGTVFAVTVNSAEIGKLAAHSADKIFKGVSVGTIPVASPESYFILNYKVARELGLTVPEGLISRANEVIR